MWVSASSSAAAEVPLPIGKAVALQRESARYEEIHECFPPAPIWAGDSLDLNVKAVLGGEAVERARASCLGFFVYLPWRMWVDHAAGRRHGQHVRVTSDWAGCTAGVRIGSSMRAEPGGRVCAVGGSPKVCRRFRGYYVELRNCTAVHLSRRNWTVVQVGRLAGVHCRLLEGYHPRCCSDLGLWCGNWTVGMFRTKTSRVGRVWVSFFSITAARGSGGAITPRLCELPGCPCAARFRNCVEGGRGTVQMFDEWFQHRPRGWEFE
jgi:hypothetical protein